MTERLCSSPPAATEADGTTFSSWCVHKNILPDSKKLGTGRENGKMLNGFWESSTFGTCTTSFLIVESSMCFIPLFIYHSHHNVKIDHTLAKGHERLGGMLLDMTYRSAILSIGMGSRASAYITRFGRGEELIGFVPR